MIYAWLYPLRDAFAGFNVLRYITFRAAMAALTAFVVSLLLGPILIRWLTRFKAHHSIARTGFQSIADKQKHKEVIPTMGGLLIIGSIVLSVLLWGDLHNRYLWIAVMSTLWLGFIGFIDDWLKLARKNSKGLEAITKFSGQILLGLLLGFYCYLENPDNARIHFPFVKDLAPWIGWLYIPFICVVISGTSNAVNLTDGLDGLAVGCAIFIGLTYSVFSYITGHAIFSSYLFLPFVKGAGELTIICAALSGAGLGFLWFNAHPANVFMGDTGSLALGGVIGTVAVLIQKEALLFIAGGIFVAEAMSVILQVLSFKFTGRRIFRMAPLHHHFQLAGWAESKIVIRFWLLTGVFCLVSLASLKLQ